MTKPRVALCALPARILDEMMRVKCVVKIEGNVASFVNAETGKTVVAMSFGHSEERSEMAMIRNGVVAYTLRINNSMVLDPNSFERLKVREKKSSKKTKVKEIVDLNEIEPDSLGIEAGPIAVLKDFDGDRLLRVKIEELLVFAKQFESEEERLSVLDETGTFVLKETKGRPELEESRQRIRDAKSKKDEELLQQALYRFSLKL